jgi:hypothetical protein
MQPGTEQVPVNTGGPNQFALVDRPWPQTYPHSIAPR